jgi:hypothetical protein
MLTTRIHVTALVLVAAALFTGTARAGTPNVYTDASGDNTSAPDIQKVTLTDAGDGTVGVEIDLAAEIPADGSVVVMGIDADRNSQTGRDGSEFMVFLWPDGDSLRKWDGSTWALFTHQATSPNAVGGRFTFTLTLADLGVQSFDFWVGSDHNDDTDVAPEDGIFTFPQTEARPSIQSIVFNATALFPKAGKVFAIPAVRIKLSTNLITGADTMSCTLSYKGKALAPAGTCAWKLPKTLRNKKLSLTVTAGYQDATQTITLPIWPK